MAPHAMDRARTARIRLLVWLVIAIGAAVGAAFFGSADAPGTRAASGGDGSAAGLAAFGDQLWHQDVADVEGQAEADDIFGHAVAIGDFNGDGRDDLAIGVPREDVGAFGDAGVVNVLYGFGGGLTAAGNQLWHQDVADVEDVAEAGDNFGGALAAGDFNSDGQDDLAIGAPGEAVGALGDAGAVNVLYGSGGGLTAAGDQLWHQDVADVEGAAEAGDSFGGALATGDFTGNGQDDLAIGVPGEAFGAFINVGAVNVLFGEPPPAATNTPTSPAASPTPTRTPTPLAGLAGDVDCNGGVNAIDAALILQLSAGLIGAVGCPQNADVNDDGSVNAIDAALVLQFVAGLIPDLPP